MSPLFLAGSASGAVRARESRAESSFMMSTMCFCSSRSRAAWGCAAGVPAARPRRPQRALDHATLARGAFDEAARWARRAGSPPPCPIDVPEVHHAAREERIEPEWLVSYAAVAAERMDAKGAWHEGTAVVTQRFLLYLERRGRGTRVKRAHVIDEIDELVEHPASRRVLIVSSEESGDPPLLLRFPVLGGESEFDAAAAAALPLSLNAGGGGGVGCVGDPNASVSPGFNRQRAASYPNPHLPCASPTELSPLSRSAEPRYRRFLDILAQVANWSHARLISRTKVETEALLSALVLGRGKPSGYIPAKRKLQAFRRQMKVDPQVHQPLPVVGSDPTPRAAGEPRMSAAAVRAGPVTHLTPAHLLAAEASVSSHAGCASGGSTWSPSVSGGSTTTLAASHSQVASLNATAPASAAAAATADPGRQSPGGGGSIARRRRSTGSMGMPAAGGSPSPGRREARLGARPRGSPQPQQPPTPSMHPEDPEAVPHSPAAAVDDGGGDTTRSTTPPASLLRGRGRMLVSGMRGGRSAAASACVLGDGPANGDAGGDPSLSPGGSCASKSASPSVSVVSAYYQSCLSADASRVGEAEGASPVTEPLGATLPASAFGGLPVSRTRSFKAAGTDAPTSPALLTSPLVRETVGGFPPHPVRSGGDKDDAARQPADVVRTPLATTGAPGTAMEGTLAAGAGADGDGSGAVGTIASLNGVATFLRSLNLTLFSPSGQRGGGGDEARATTTAGVAIGIGVDDDNDDGGVRRRDEGAAPRGGKQRSLSLLAASSDDSMGDGAAGAGAGALQVHTPVAAATAAALDRPHCDGGDRCPGSGTATDADGHASSADDSMEGEDSMYSPCSAAPSLATPCVFRDGATGVGFVVEHQPAAAPPSRDTPPQAALDAPRTPPTPEAFNRVGGPMTNMIVAAGAGVGPPVVKTSLVAAAAAAPSSTRPRRKDEFFRTVLSNQSLVDLSADDVAAASQSVRSDSHVAAMTTERGRGRPGREKGGGTTGFRRRASTSPAPSPTVRLRAQLESELLRGVFEESEEESPAVGAVRRALVLGDGGRFPADDAAFADKAVPRGSRTPPRTPTPAALDPRDGGIAPQRKRPQALSIATLDVDIAVGPSDMIASPHRARGFSLLSPKTTTTTATMTAAAVAAASPRTRAKSHTYHGGQYAKALGAEGADAEYPNNGDTRRGLAATLNVATAAARRDKKAVRHLTNRPNAKGVGLGVVRTMELPSDEVVEAEFELYDAPPVVHINNKTRVRVGNLKPDAQVYGVSGADRVTSKLKVQRGSCCLLKYFLIYANENTRVTRLMFYHELIDVAYHMATAHLFLRPKSAVAGKTPAVLVRLRPEYGLSYPGPLAVFLGNLLRLSNVYGRNKLAVRYLDDVELHRLHDPQVLAKPPGYERPQMKQLGSRRPKDHHHVASPARRTKAK